MDGWVDGWVGGWMGGPLLQEILPLCGFILQVGTCQIPRLAENPRWSRVWQYFSFVSATALEIFNVIRLLHYHIIHLIFFSHIYLTK